MLKAQMISIDDQLNYTVLVANQQAHSRLLHPFGIDCMEHHRWPRHHISPFASHSVDRPSKPAAVTPEAYYHTAEPECKLLESSNR
jgi:hypothetical protein